MSGVEVAGLVLGAVPIVIGAIDGYKGQVNRLKSGFRKRKVIEKLGRALRYQKSIIEAITRNVLVNSGCDIAAGTSEVQLRTILLDKQTQDMVDDFLGTDNAQVFLDALVDCMASVSHATIGLATLVPELAAVKKNTDVQAVLNANAASAKGQLQFFARLSMVFNLENIEDQIKALDRSTDLLDKFARNFTVNHQPGQNTPSRKAARLAKALQVVRQHAISLHSALTHRWVGPCHQQHELKLFLDHRITELKPKQAVTEEQAFCFKVIFVSGTTQSTDLWHETYVHAEAEDCSTNAAPLSPTSPPQGPRIRFITPQQPCRTPRHDVQDICAVINNSSGATHHPIFYLAGSVNIAMTLHAQTTATSLSVPSSSATLQKILQNRHNQTLPSASLPWKWRMLLALNLASSFLQFIRTSWVQPSWDASTIHIPYKTDDQHFDLNRPFISASFSTISCEPANRQAQVKEDLLDLGVLLLEIWHEINFETKFASQPGTSNASIWRRACALQWLDDLQNPLPDLYYRATSHCVSGLITPDLRTTGWDDPDIWKSVCENVVEPLSKLAQI